MPDNMDRDLAITKNNLEHLERAISTLAQTVADNNTTLSAKVDAVDSKLDVMGATYLTAAEWSRWKKEDYAPHKDAVEAKFRQLGERQTKWIGMVVGAIITASLTLTVYLIVQAVGSTKP
jgi:hypothetical protein